MNLRLKLNITAHFLPLYKNKTERVGGGYCNPSPTVGEFLKSIVLESGWKDAWYLFQTVFKCARGFSSTLNFQILLCRAESDLQRSEGKAVPPPPRCKWIKHRSANIREAVRERRCNGGEKCDLAVEKTLVTKKKVKSLILVTAVEQDNEMPRLPRAPNEQNACENVKWKWGSH